MKVVIIGAVTAIMFGAILSPQVGAQSVETTIYNDKLQVSGRVLPAHTVVVDNADNIVEIMSNTNEDVEPQIFRGRVTPASRINVTDKINQQYRSIVQPGTGKIGVLYKKEVNAQNSLTPALTAPGVIRRFL